MMFMQSAKLPPLDISPVHVQITIHSGNGEYVAYVITEMGAFPITIRLKPHDVKNLNELLQGAIQEVASSFDRRDAYEAALGELARVGNYAFRRIFASSHAQSIIRKALDIGRVLQIVSKDFFIPWELLYDGPVASTQANICNYWGMRHIISRTIILDERPGAYVPPIIETNRPEIGLITSDALPLVVNQEIPAFKELHRSKRIKLAHLRDLSATRRATELAEIERFLGRDLQILHFACHAYERDPLEQSYLFITKDFALSMIDFVVGQYELKHRPFVVLNACLTGVSNPLHTSSWAEKLWERGARGVLATDFHVPDRFAADFSEMLYPRLLSGIPIGEALLAIRYQLWEEQRNLLALAYVLYSSPSIKIMRSKKKIKIA